MIHPRPWNYPTSGPVDELAHEEEDDPWVSFYEIVPERDRKDYRHTARERTERNY
jgi:hypothetical protein